MVRVEEQIEIGDTDYGEGCAVRQSEWEEEDDELDYGLMVFESSGGDREKQRDKENGFNVTWPALEPGKEPRIDDDESKNMNNEDGFADEVEFAESELDCDVLDLVKETVAGIWREEVEVAQLGEDGKNETKCYDRYAVMRDDPS